jgi:hypothetical protein
MKEFSPYIATLRRLDERVRRELGSGVDGQLNAALDGGAQGALRSLVDGHKLREHGAFFTGSRLSRRAIGLMASTLSRRSVVLDPACGAGDLLLAAARALPATKDAETVLDAWSRQIHGRDLRSSFVEAARLRLLWWRDGTTQDFQQHGLVVVRKLYLVQHRWRCRGLPPRAKATELKSV